MNLCVFVFVVSTTVANAVLNNGFLGQRSGLNNQKRESEDSTLYYDPKSPEPIDEAASFVQLGSSKKETTDHTWYYDPKDPPIPIAEASSFIQVGSAMYNRATLHRTSLTLEMKVEQSKAERKFREMSEESKKELERKSLARALTARKKYDEAMSSLEVVKMQENYIYRKGNSQVVAADEALAEFLQATDKYQQSVQEAPNVHSGDAPNKEAATLGMDNEALQKEVASLKVDLAQMQLDKVTKIIEQPNAAKMSLIASSRKASSALSLIQSSKVEKSKLALDELQNAAESEGTLANVWSDHLAQWMTQDGSNQAEEAKLALSLKSAAESEAERERKNAWSHHLSNWMTKRATNKASRDWSHHLSNWMTQGATNKASMEGNADWRHGDEDQWHGMMSRMMGRMVKSDDPDSFVQVSSEHGHSSAAADVDMLAKAKIVEALYGVDKYSETPGMPTPHDHIRVTANGHMNNGFVDL